MTERSKGGSARGLARLPIHRRIRRLREEKGLAAYELAKLAGISPSYLSLIEGGEKVPSEEVALRLADALGDDRELYRGWAHAGGRDGIRRLLGSLERFVKYSKRPEWDQAVSLAGKALGDQAFDAVSEFESSVRAEVDPAAEGVRFDLLQAPEAEAEQGGPDLVDIPLLGEGAYPGDDPTTCDHVVETLRFDPRVLADSDVERPFAYRPAEAMLSRVRDMIHPGDLVILSRRMGALTPESVHAVRYRKRTVLSRVLFKGNALLLLPPAGSSDFAQIDVANRSELSRIIVGTVVLTVRAWGRRQEPSPDRMPALSPRVARSNRSASGWFLPPTTTPSAMQSVELSRRSQRRGAKVEEGLLIRDCEWRDKYGWRPVQRAEDLDILERYPGMRIRYRLIRDDRVLYHLEMGPKEWRRALGDYVDGPTWRRNGYVTAITRMQRGRYTMEFKDRWAPHVTPVTEP